MKSLTKSLLATAALVLVGLSTAGAFLCVSLTTYKLTSSLAAGIAAGIASAALACVATSSLLAE